MDDKHKIIQALDKTKKAVPSGEFLNRMEKFAVAYAIKMNSFSRETLIGIAASFLILISVNIYAINAYSSDNSTLQQETSSETYNLIPTKSLYQ